MQFTSSFNINMRSNMHKKSFETERGSKISRLQFLRLLGAGAIGYFAYRAGFINNLFGNATATTAVAAGTNATSQRYAATGSVQMKMVYL